MATTDQINTIVLNFAKSTTLTVTPSSIMDPIVPAPAAITPAVFNQFYFDLLNALTAGGISAAVPMDSIRAATVWLHISMVVFHFQS
jgi:hypothetical protein